MQRILNDSNICWYTPGPSQGLKIRGCQYWCGGIIGPPGWYSVSWSAKIWRCRGTPGTLRDDRPAHRERNSTKGPYLNYVVSKSSPLSSFLLSRVYVVNRLWGYNPSPHTSHSAYVATAASKSTGAKGHVPKIYGFVPPLHWTRA